MTFRMRTVLIVLAAATILAILFIYMSSSLSVVLQYAPSESRMKFNEVLEKKQWSPSFDITDVAENAFIEHVVTATTITQSAVPSSASPSSAAPSAAAPSAAAPHSAAPSSASPSSATTQQHKEETLFDPFYHQHVLQLKTSKETKHSACQIPLMNPWDKRVLPHLRKLAKVKKEGYFTECKTPPSSLLVYVSNRTIIRINETVARHRKDKNITNDCKVQFFSRINDKQQTWSELFDLRVGQDFKLPNLEQFAQVKCESEGAETEDYRQVLFRLAETPEIIKKVENQKQHKRRRLSVLLFINDGISHLMSRRVMNKTYYYLLNEQKGVALNGYHSVGLNTFPNMVPYLTGHHIQELEKYEGKFFDNLKWPFLWRDFNERSYVTGYVEDTSYSTFNYLKKGFYKQPTDYYFKNFVNTVGDKHCCLVTGERTHSLMLKLLEDFLHLHEANDYFFWWFLNGLSHSTFEPLARADLEYYQFFKKHFEKGTFNNTLLIFGSDHGSRFSSIRKTFVGQTEERLPLQLLVFPDWFKKEHKDLYETLLGNTESLTTPFDMHETIMGIMNEFKQPNPLTNHTTKSTIKLGRGVNLLKEKVPLSRTCRDAGIPDRFCVCRKYTPLPVNSETVIYAVNTSISHINGMLKRHSDICEHVVLQKIVTAQSFNGKTKPKKKVSSVQFIDYRVIFETKPGNALYEATVRKTEKSEDFKVIGAIVRISLYGNTSICISDTHLRNYCFCRNQITVHDYK